MKLAVTLVIAYKLCATCAILSLCVSQRNDILPEFLVQAQRIGFPYFPVYDRSVSSLFFSFDHALTCCFETGTVPGWMGVRDLTLCAVHKIVFIMFTAGVACLRSCPGTHLGPSRMAILVPCRGTLLVLCISADLTYVSAPGYSDSDHGICHPFFPSCLPIHCAVP